jgi:hypothetical protein
MRAAVGTFARFEVFGAVRIPMKADSASDRTIEGLVTFMLQYRRASNSVYNPNPAF